MYETDGLLCGDIRSDGEQYAVAGMSQDVEIVDVAKNVCVAKLGMGGLHVASELDRPPASKRMHTRAECTFLTVAAVSFSLPLPLRTLFG